MPEPPALYTQTSLAGLGACDSTLRQHAHCCAGILASRLASCPRLDGPHASAVSPSLRHTATTVEDSSLPAVGIGSRQQSDVPVLVALPIDEASQIEECAFSGRPERHLAVVCHEGSGPDRQRNLFLVEVATGLLTHASSTQGRLQLYWAPSAELLAACSAHTIVIVSASGDVLARQPHSSIAALAWQPDSSRILACKEDGELLSMRVQDTRLVEHNLAIWEVRRMAFLPCSRHGRFWVALLLRWVTTDHQMCVDLRPAVALDGRDTPFAGELPPVGPCTHMAATAQHVAVCCSGPGRSEGPGCIYVFAIVSDEQHLSLQPQQALPTRVHPGAFALSPCGFWLAFIKAPWKRCVACQVGVIGLHASELKRDWPVEAHLLAPCPTMQWTPDCSRLAVTASGHLPETVAAKTGFWRCTVFAFD